MAPISSAASSVALAGEYSVTINDGFLKDYRGNAAASYSFTHTIGCDSLMSRGRASSTSARLGTSRDKQTMHSVNLWNISTTRYSSIITGIVCFSFGIIFTRVFSSSRAPRVHEDVDVLVPLNGAKDAMIYGSSL